MDYISAYEVHTTNAEIAASASAYFFNAVSDKQNKDKHGSFNYLEIINDGDISIKFQLDGLATRERELFGKSTIVMKAEESIFFDTLKVTNMDAVTAIAAGKLLFIARILKPVIVR